jgi:chemotaxis protein CheC
MAERYPGTGLLEESAMREVSNIGAAHAGHALAEMLGRPVTIDVPRVSTHPGSLDIERSEELCACVYMPFEGDVRGHVALVFPWPAARALLRIMLGSDCPSPGGMSELEASALLESGNIVNSSFLCGIARMSGLKLYATPPYLSVDMCAASVDAVLSEAALSGEEIVAIDTRIEDAADAFRGHFLYVPERSGFTRLFRSCLPQEAAS